jgi:PAS domain S-box-containing protein
MDTELTRQILSLKDGDHLCLFYENGPAEQMPALVPFIQEGLSRDEQFIYIADDQTVDELASRLIAGGIDVGKETDRGALKLWTRKHWRQPGKLSSKEKSLQVKGFINEAAKTGFKDSRFAVEMTWALGPDIEPSNLEHWEATLNTIFVPGFRGRIICQYNRSRLSPEALLAALHTHPLVILGNHVYPNWFYEAPMILNDGSAAARVDWMISVLERARAAQREREELIEKRAALAQAELSKKKIENILSLMPAAVYTCDEQGRMTFYNRRAAELWGHEPKLNELEEKFWGSFRLWRPDGSRLLHDETPVAKVMRSGQPDRNKELTIERPDGSRIAINVNIDPLYGTSGRPCGAINVFQDIGDSKQAEQAAQRLAAIVESSDDAIISKDLNGIITSWNQGAERLFGYTSEEAIGKSITILIPVERYNEERGILERIRRGERIEHYETIRQRRDGSLLDISLTVSPIKDASGTVIGASKIARDITDRKRAEAALREVRDKLAKANRDLEQRVKNRTAELQRANAALVQEMEEQRRLEQQLRQAQKMESIGTLAGGIAHDFNNVLNIIRGYASFIRRQSSIDGEVAENLKIIDEATERAASVVRQLLTLARKTEPHLVDSDINGLLSGLVNLLKQTLPKTIDISLELRPKLPLLMADPNQITQALLNLCVNARDAMPNGGTLALKTSVVGAAKVKDASAQAEQYVCIEVTDSGEGIDSTVRNRIFEPFFTTKGIGQGTGLGLAIVYGIVKNHNGFIDVESELGRSTTFRWYLPVPSSEKKTITDELIRAKISGQKPTNGQPTLLLVEDEEMMVLLLRKALSTHGYKVLVALDGQEALDLFNRHKHEIDVVLLDMGLPKKAGWDVIVEMKKQKPGISVVVSSGYIDPESRARILRVGVKDFIDKPYTPDILVETIDAVLEESHSSETLSS